MHTTVHDINMKVLRSGILNHPLAFIVQGSMDQFLKERERMGVRGERGMWHGKQEHVIEGVDAYFVPSDFCVDNVNYVAFIVANRGEKEPNTQDLIDFVSSRRRARQAANVAKKAAKKARVDKMYSCHLCKEGHCCCCSECHDYSPGSSGCCQTQKQESVAENGGDSNSGTYARADSSESFMRQNKLFSDAFSDIFSLAAK